MMKWAKYKIWCKKLFRFSALLDFLHADDHWRPHNELPIVAWRNFILEHTWACFPLAEIGTCSGLRVSPPYPFLFLLHPPRELTSKKRRSSVLLSVGGLLTKKRSKKVHYLSPPISPAIPENPIQISPFLGNHSEILNRICNSPLRNIAYASSDYFFFFLSMQFSGTPPPPKNLPFCTISSCGKFQNLPQKPIP